MWPGVLVAPHQPHPAADGTEQHEQLPGQQGEGDGGRGVVRVCPHDQGIQLPTILREVSQWPGKAPTRVFSGHCETSRMFIDSFIRDASPGDSGDYECQVSGPNHTTSSKMIHLNVIGWSGLEA